MSARRLRPGGALIGAFAIAVGGAAGFAWSTRAAAPETHEITVRARQYGYDPEVIRVHEGDTLKLRFVSEDVVHGFYLEGHDVDVEIVPLQPKVELRHPSRPGEVERVEEVVVKADREGKFRYRCSHTCGFLHPFMLGELIVEPNRLLGVSMGMAAGLLLGAFGLVLARAEGSEER